MPTQAELEPATADPDSMRRPDAAPPSPDQLTSAASEQGWSLGLDLGTTGLSAVLLRHATGELYPLYWTRSQPSPDGRVDSWYRLPLAVLVDERYTSDAPARQRSLEEVQVVPLDAPAQSLSEQASPSPLKPYFNLGIPYYSLPTQRWEPVLQWSDQHQLPLAALRYGLHQALLTLAQAPTPVGSGAIRCEALGLDPQTLESAMQTLTRVGVGAPLGWTDAYRANVQQALLAGGLVQQPEQVMFVNDAIAALMSRVHGVDGQSVVMPSALSAAAVSQPPPWHGPTLVISAGAGLTELLMIDLPDDASSLYDADFALRRLDYGGTALDQDILCRLLYPLWLDAAAPSAALAALWRRVDLESLELPGAGEPAVPQRVRLQQRLNATLEGQQLLDAAHTAKLSLQQQSSHRLTLGDQDWILNRQDLGSQVILPYVQRLNREVNTLLNEMEWSIGEIRQILCTGGTASLGAIARWLGQKLPNATIIQDTYPVMDGTVDQQALPCSRVAYGLAAIPLHPPLAIALSAMKDDLTLLRELVGLWSGEALSVGEIMQRLEQRGIDASLHQPRIVALLEGHWPMGLAPAAADLNRFTTASLQNPDYERLLSTPLFYKLGAQLYLPKPSQLQHVRRYLEDLAMPLGQPSITRASQA